jgi:hypothetical protein
MSRAEETRKEIERLKSIEILPGEYQLISQPGIIYEILSTDENSQTALVKTVKSGFEQTKTLHWCRKRLKRVR